MAEQNNPLVDSTNKNGNSLRTIPSGTSYDGDYSSRSDSFSDDPEDETPLERITAFDIVSNLAIHERFQRWKERANRSQERIRTSSQLAKEKVVGEWRKRRPTADEQLAKYRERIRTSFDRLTVPLKQKVSFIAGVMNILVIGFLIGGYPEYFHYLYTAQLFYFMPIRIYTYKKKGYHYFLADLCYFVNFLTVLSIYAFPGSKRLLISAFCLAFGNNAFAIAMWRNSLVFHTMDKVVSLFVHIMPPLTLHSIIHLTPPALQKTRFPAVYAILNSQPGDKGHYSLWQMMLWATLPYAVWQLSYHFFICVLRADKIRAGNPTSYTWLRKSFANVWIGRHVLSLSKRWQEPAYMAIQYIYAMLTMLPCPLWLWSRWASGIFLSTVFTLSVWNGATFYIDVFGKHFEKELNSLKRDFERLNQSTLDACKLSNGLLTPGAAAVNPLGTPCYERQPPILDNAKKPILESPMGLNASGKPIDKHALPGLDGGIDVDNSPGKHAVEEAKKDK